MAQFAACTRESRCTSSRIHQHIEKNSVPLKEVLTGKRHRAQRSSTRDRATDAQDDARTMRIFAVRIFRECKKCLCCRTFFDRNSMRANSSHAFRKQQRARKTWARGLRVAIFGNEKIFVLNAAGASAGRVEGGTRAESSTADSERAARDCRPSSRGSETIQGRPRCSRLPLRAQPRSSPTPLALTRGWRSALG